MKQFATSLLVLIATTFAAHGQHTLRPDAFPPEPEPPVAKAVTMATTIDEMASWDRYPTYDVYVEMMSRFAINYPEICRLDTIGFSVDNRMILCAVIHSRHLTQVVHPEFFYSSTMHGDEVTGFYFMLRLIDTLLRGYGVDSLLTNLVNEVVIYINPLANPDGTYRSGNSTINGSTRYNANGVDLNRNYPDPFGIEAEDPLQLENQAMMDYVGRHNFRMSANLHGGAEVMNYPWDSFTSNERQHPDWMWWEAVGRRYVDSVRAVAPTMFRTRGGVTAGGDWYVISNGRQDWMNFYANCREMTIEVSTAKTLANNKLNTYWNAQYRSLVGYIQEIFNCPTANVSVSAPTSGSGRIKVGPNPTTGVVTVETESGSHRIDLSDRPSGLHVITIDGRPIKVIKL